jgi:hypothetical protein
VPLLILDYDAGSLRDIIARLEELRAAVFGQGAVLFVQPVLVRHRIGSEHPKDIKQLFVGPSWETIPGKITSMASRSKWLDTGAPWKAPAPVSMLLPGETIMASV